MSKKRGNLSNVVSLEKNLEKTLTRKETPKPTPAPTPCGEQRRRRAKVTRCHWKYTQSTCGKLLWQKWDWCYCESTKSSWGYTKQDPKWCYCDYGVMKEDSHGFREWHHWCNQPCAGTKEREPSCEDETNGKLEAQKKQMSVNLDDLEPDCDAK